MMWSTDRELRRGTSVAHALALAATIAWLAACEARQPNVARHDGEPAATEPVEPPSDPSAADARFAWPAPPGWGTETIPFPLGFAPTLSYVGVEELRFAPGMFKAGSEELWTYAFVWWLQGDVAFDAATLNGDLAAYFEGLSLAVEQREGFDPKDAAAVAKLSSAESSEAGTARWVGTVSTYDAFVTHARIELNVDVRAFRCVTQDRTVALFTISPQPSGGSAWTKLEALRKAFRCAE